MQSLTSLKSAERKAFQTSIADGLWDVLIGCILLIFALAPLLSEPLGDFWSSMIFLPFWGLVYLAIRLARKHLVAPRIGTARFSQARRKKISTLNTVIISIITFILLLGLGVVLIFNHTPGTLLAGILGVLLLAGFSAAAYYLDYPRLYYYGLLLLPAPMVGEWLSTQFGVPHHGFPLVFGFSSGFMIMIGLVTFVRLMITTPKVELPDGI